DGTQTNRRPAARSPAGGVPYAPDPIWKKKNKNPAEKKINLGSKSSLLLPKHGCKQLSHCTTSTIANCFAVHASADYNAKRSAQCVSNAQNQHEQRAKQQEIRAD